MSSRMSVLAGGPALALALALALAAGPSGCGGGDDDDDDDDDPDPTRLISLSTSVGTLIPAFDPEIFEYDLDLLLVEDEVIVTPTGSSGPEIRVAGEVVASGDASAPLAVELGEGIIAVDSTLDATHFFSNYTIHVHRGVDALSSINPALGDVAPAFDSAQGAYVLGLGHTESSVTLQPRAWGLERSTITIDGEEIASGTISPPIALELGSTLVTVEVTSVTRPDATRTYEIDIGRGADALAAVSLSYAGGALSNPLSPAVDPDTLTYAANVGLWVQHLQVSVTPLVPGGTATVFGGPAPPGTPSPALSLNLGLTSIPIVLTASDGAQQTYTLDVSRAAAVLQEAYVKPSNTDADDQFGVAIALSGNTLAVGAETEDSAAVGVGGNQNDDSAADSGAVYVFTRTGASWAQQAYIKASNSGAGDLFGGAIALSGDTLLVGARGEDSAATGVGGNQADDSAADSGAAYVFTRTGTTWTQQAYLKASNTGVEDLFGRAVALHEDTVVIGSFETSGSPGIDGDQTDDSMPDAGAAYVFTRSGTTWSQQAYVKSAHPAINDGFSLDVAVWGDIMVASAANEDSAATGVDGDQTDDSSTNSGAVFVFTRTGETWAQTSYLKASTNDPGDSFGRTVALWGDTLAVGADGEDSAADGIDGDQSDDSALDAGAVYVFTRAEGTWSQEAYLKATNPRPIGGFGKALAIWGDTIAVGAFFESSNSTGINSDSSDTSAFQAGAAYVFVRDAGTWSTYTYLKASNTEAGASFGHSIDIWGDTVASGARLEDSGATGIDGDQSDQSADESGAAYIFR